MTMAGTTAQIVIEAPDRASANLARVGANMQRVQRQAVGMTAQFTRMSGAAGAAGRAVGMLGIGFGPVAIAITAASIGIGIATSRLSSMVAQSREASRAGLNLRNSLLFAGFSASNATRAINDLRSSLGKASFSAIPKMDLAMRLFWLRLDRDSAMGLKALQKALVELTGLKPEEVMEALGEAAQGNFTLISQIAGKPIASMEELQDVVRRVEKEVVIAKNPILIAFQDLANGSGTFEQRLDALRDAVLTNGPILSNTFRDHGGIITKILQSLSKEQRDLVTVHAESWRTIGLNQRAAKNVFIEELQKIRVAIAETIREMEALERLQSKTVGQPPATPVAPSKVVPAPGPSIGGGGTSLVATAFSPSGRVLSGGEATNVFEALAGTGPSGWTLTPGGKWIPPNFAHGGIVPGPIGAPVPAIVHGGETVIPSGGGIRQPIVVQIGDRTIAELVLDVLNGQVRLREPRLGLG